MVVSPNSVMALALVLAPVPPPTISMAPVVPGAPEPMTANAVAGMATIGVGAALANPQLSGVVLALAPPRQAGMASAVTFVVRQAGLAISIAALGLTLGAVDAAAEFAPPFALAALVALLGTIAALILLPAKVAQGSKPG